MLIDALWSPAGKGLTYWLSFVMSNCEVVTFPNGILGQVWCLIISIPDFSRFLTKTCNHFVKSVDALIRHFHVTNCHNFGMKLPYDRIRIVTCQFIFLLTWHDTTLWFINNFPYRHSSVFFQGFNQLG